MLKLDHLALITPSLEEGAEFVREQLGIEPPYGGKHPQMGTHNLLLRLGLDVFLEVIAVDPNAQKPEKPRWFGLDDVEAVRKAWDDGRHLRAWVARTNDLSRVLDRHGALLGDALEVSRGDRRWMFAARADGSLPHGGAIPCVMDWGVRGNPAASMQDFGLRLATFQLTHPDPASIQRLYWEMEIVDPPTVIEGEQLTLQIEVETPQGRRNLS